MENSRVIIEQHFDDSVTSIISCTLNLKVMTWSDIKTLFDCKVFVV